MKKLADDSITGKWVANCNYAVVVLTDPTLPYHMIDAGRAVCIKISRGGNRELLNVKMLIDRESALAR